MDLFTWIMGALMVVFGLIAAYVSRKAAVYQDDDSESEPVEPPEAPNLPVEAPEEPVKTEPAPIPIKDNLEEFCLAIRDFEGIPKYVNGKLVGDRNYLNNNPGNCRYYYGGYLPMYGIVGKDKDGFARFRDYETGFLYLKNMVKNMAKNHPMWTITDFVSHYAPASDNNPVDAYARFIAKRIGQSTGARLKDLFA